MFRSWIIALVLVIAGFSKISAQSPQLLFPNIDTSPGSTVCFEVLSQDFDSIFTIQFSFQWDTSVLQFVSVEGFGFPNVSQGNFGNAKINEGKLSFSWFPFTGAPLSLPDSTLVFELCFEVVGNAGQSTTVSLGNDPTSIEVTKPGSTDNVGLLSSGGQANVVGNQLLNLFVDDITVAQGESFGLDVTPTFFDSLVDLQTSFAWDPAVIAFDSVGNFQLPGLDGADFDEASAPAGLLGLQWDAPGGNPITFPDNNTLFTIYFTALGSSGDSTFVSFTDDLVAPAATNGNGLAVTLDTFPGLVNIFTPLTICVDDQVVNQSDTLCVPLVVTDFDSILSIQYTLAWDTAMLQLTGLQNFNLQYLDLQEFNLTQINEGLLSLSWFDEDFSSESLPDSTVIFEACFVAVGPIGDSTSLSFVEEPTEIEVRDKNGNDVGLNEKLGIIQIESAILIIDTLISGVNCYFPDTGAIDLTIEGGEPPYTFEWETGATTEDVDGLFFGEYTVTITDAASNTHTLVSTFLIPGDFAAPDATVFNDTLIIDCDELPLIIEATGSTGGPYIYDWSTGTGNILDTVTNPFEALATQPGVYVFSVVDTSNGCGNFDSTVVVADFEFPFAEAGPNQRLSCANTITLLNGTGSSTGPQFGYAWTTPDGNIIADSNSLFPQVNQPGEYQLAVYDSLSTCTSVSTTTVTIDTVSPFINLGPDQPFTCDDDFVILTPDSVDAGFDFFYEWSAIEGEVDTANEQQQVFVYAPGEYQLVVFNANNGCTDTSTIAVFPDTLAPEIQLDTPAILSCVNSQATIIASPQNPPTAYEYKWTPLTGGLIVSGGNSSQVVVGALGTYRLVVTDSTNGCRTISDIDILEDPEAPISEAGPDTALTCVVDEIQLNAAASAISGSFSLEWQTAQGGAIDNGQGTLQPLVSTPGLYTLIVTDDVSGCQDSSTLEVVLDTVPPVANAGADKEITCVSLTVLLGSPFSSQGPEFSYQWTTPDGNLSSADTLVIATANEVGTYFLEVLNNRTGCVATDTVEVFMSQDIPMSDPGMDMNLTCTDTLLWLGGPNSTAGPNITYLWSTVDGDILEGEDSTYALVNTPGEYTLVVTDESNDCFGFASVTVAFDTLPPTAIVGDSFLINCFNPQQTLNAGASSIGPQFSYEWQTDTGNFLSADTVLNPVVNGQGAYVLNVTNNENGCTAADSAFVTVDTLQPELILTSSGNINCVQTQVTLDGSASDSGPGFDFGWSPSTPLSNDTTLMPQTTTPGDYVLTITNLANGCTAVDTISVLADTTAPQASIFGPAVITCGQPVLTLDGTSSSSGPEFTYLWTTPNGNILDGANTNLPSVDLDGLYELLVTDTSNGCTQSTSITVGIDTIAPLVDAGNDFDMGCSVDPVSLSAQVDAQGDSLLIQWSGGPLLDGAETLTPTVQGPALFTLQVTDLLNGCSGSDEVEVTQVNDLQEAMAGEDVSACPDELITLSALLPAGSGGGWSSPTGGTVEEPGSPLTVVEAGLQAGENLFVWSLSTDDCPDYDADTVVVNIAGTPTAVDDNLLIPFGPDDYDIPVVDNDILPGDDWSVTLLTQPDFGSVTNNGDGSLAFASPGLFSGELSFAYALCNDQCADLCDTGIVNIVIDQPGPFDIDSIFIPNVITPNEDGLNDRLIFDFLNIYSGQFRNPELVVFSRWGDVLFEAEPYQNDWDGRDQNGNELPEGTYYFILRLKVPDGQVIKGDVTILR